MSNFPETGLVLLCICANSDVKLGLAYETLKDGSKRRAYDFIYPSISQKQPSSSNTQTPQSQQDIRSEAAQIAALQKSKQERAARWWTRKTAFDSRIFEVQRAIRPLQQEIRNINSILAAVSAAEAQKNSWTTWLLSPIYKKAEESEETKERKGRETQEKRIERDMKQRRLEAKYADLKKEEASLKTAKYEVDAANREDDHRIQVIQAGIYLRAERERQARERVERDRLEKIRKQQQELREQREREAEAALMRLQAAARAAAQKQQEDETRRYQEILENASYARCSAYSSFAGASTYQSFASTSCTHDGWWPKQQGRTACPECSEVWTYLLECPGCAMKACPKCQARLRPRLPRHAARMNRRAPPRMRTPSPDYDFYESYF